MSILGVVVRTSPQRLKSVADRLVGLPGVDLALNPGDGRLVAVMEEAVDASGERRSAAATLADVAQWPEILSTSLVYEYSGDEVADAPDGLPVDYRAWRDSLGGRPAGKPADS